MSARLIFIIKMDAIEKMLTKQKFVINVCVEHNGKFFILNTIIVKGWDICIAPHVKVGASFRGVLPPIKKPVHEIIGMVKIPKEELRQTFSPEPIHISLHALKRINVKSSNKNYLAPRGYTDLLNTKEVTDVFLFIPGNPLEHEAQKKHLKNYCTPLKLPENFDNTKQVIEFKLAVAPSNVDPRAVDKYQRLYPGGTKFTFTFFDLYLHYRVTNNSKNRGMYMLFYKYVDPKKIIKK